MNSKSGSYDNPIKAVEFELTKGEIKTINFTHKTRENELTGFYGLDVNIATSDELTLVNYWNPESINIVSDEWTYFYADDLIKVNKDSLGAGNLVAGNVDLVYKEDAILKSDYHSILVKNPINTRSTGQVRTKSIMTYGSYESNIKVPNSDAILSGFFLYNWDENNDSIHYEIDMEIVKYDGKWQLWNTIYNSEHPKYEEYYAKLDPDVRDPGQVFHKRINLDFDPSTDYHSYRINYYEDHISFELDGKEIARWSDSFAYRDMYIYNGMFYANFLSKQRNTESIQYMDTKWMRRAYMK